MIDRVTITGPDDSIQPEALVPISEQYPFVEWGILVSARGAGYRFPSRRWIDRLQSLASTKDMRLSLHVCGRWVRDLLMGEMSMPTELLNCFGRVQLNFHAERTQCRPEAFHAALLKIAAARQFIFQIDGAGGNEHLESLFGENQSGAFVDAVPLFDVSGGAGVLPEMWPKPIYMDSDEAYAYHGYAGGLGPDNLPDEIPKILAAAHGARIWIDMETRVRSCADALFDLEKVRRCLAVSAPFVSAPLAPTP